MLSQLSYCPTRGRIVASLDHTSNVDRDSARDRIHVMSTFKQNAVVTELQGLLERVTDGWVARAD